MACPLQARSLFLFVTAATPEGTMGRLFTIKCTYLPNLPTYLPAYLPTYLPTYLEARGESNSSASHKCASSTYITSFYLTSGSMIS